MNTVTKTEMSNRLRAAAKAARAAANLPKNWRTELGVRGIHQHIVNPDNWNGYDTPGDDLDGMTGIEDHPESIRGDGYVAHLYFSSNGAWGQLEDIVVVWCGTATQEPVVLDVNGRRYQNDTPKGN